MSSIYICTEDSVLATLICICIERKGSRTSAYELNYTYTVAVYRLLQLCIHIYAPTIYVYVYPTKIPSYTIKVVQIIPYNRISTFNKIRNGSLWVYTVCVLLWMLCKFTYIQHTEQLRSLLN